MKRLRPHTAAWRGVAVAFLALAFAALLNAHGLQKTATIQSDGVRRDLALDVTRQLVRVSDAVRLSEPRKALKAVLGRSSDDVVEATIDLPLAVGALRQPPTIPRFDKPGSASTDSGDGPRVAPKKPAYSPRRPLRVWIAGDSLVAIPGAAVERAVRPGGAIEVVGVESRLATGLGRPDVFNWYRRFREVIRDKRPDVVILSFGSNDGHDYLSGVPEGVAVGPLGSATWIREYGRRISGITSEFGKAGAHVIWLGLPKTQSDKRNRSFRVVNSVIRSVTSNHVEKPAYVDTWRMFTNRYRSYVEYMRNADGRLVRMRGADGVHYEPAAGDVLARHLLALLDESYDLASWRRKGADVSGTGGAAPVP